MVEEVQFSGNRRLFFTNFVQVCFGNWIYPQKDDNMNGQKWRFLFYTIIGLVFGVLDWFYLNWLAYLNWGGFGQSFLVVPVILLMNYGIWLVPFLPVVIYEGRRSEKIGRPMLAGALTWSCSIFSYYAYYSILLSTGKLIQLEHLNIFGEKYTTFWPEYWAMFDRIILSQFLEWIIIAIIGGASIGALFFRFFARKPKATSSGIE